MECGQRQLEHANELDANDSRHQRAAGGRFRGFWGERDIRRFRHRKEYETSDGCGEPSPPGGAGTFEVTGTN